MAEDLNKLLSSNKRLEKGTRVRVNENVAEFKRRAYKLEVDMQGTVLLGGKILLVAWDNGQRGTINIEEVDQV
jgi:hypothetical protein